MIFCTGRTRNGIFWNILTFRCSSIFGCMNQGPQVFKAEAVVETPQFVVVPNFHMPIVAVGFDVILVASTLFFSTWMNLP